ncbi:MAG: hypothetical protein OXF52_06020, partial [Candidatus Dadabacteria bacterium]|nr:hypothetical protein [Candidatus Dadabacteria bacterium]
ALNYFYAHPKPFSVSDFVEWLGEDVEISRCYMLLRDDCNLVRLNRSVFAGGNVFISENMLFRWWLSFNLRLSYATINNITRKGLSTSMYSLTQQKNWGEVHLSIVEYGERFGFVVSDKLAGQYRFPLAHLFSFLKNTHKSILRKNLSLIKHKEVRALLLRESFPESMNQYLVAMDERSRFILERRHLNADKWTLDMLGAHLGVTRERVRQLEVKAKKRLPVEIILRILVAEFIRGSGRLLFRKHSGIYSYARFLKVFLKIPYEEFSSSGDGDILLFGADRCVDFKQIKNKIDTSSVRENLLKVYPFLLNNDISNLTKFFTKMSHYKMNREERLYLVLKRIGRPAHYGEVANLHNDLFPESPLNFHSVNAVLCSRVGFEKYGIVWVGIKGTYALKEQGYTRPHDGLFDAVERIVTHLYKKTKQPVHFNTIMSELSKERHAPLMSSVNIATSMHDKLERLGNGFFVPCEQNAEIPLQNDEKDLDKIFSSFSE